MFLSSLEKFKRVEATALAASTPSTAAGKKERNKKMLIL
jgi:hypothetical protein